MRLFSDKHIRTAVITVLCFVFVLCVVLYAGKLIESRSQGSLLSLGGAKADADLPSEIPDTLDIKWKSGGVYLVCSDSISELCITQTDVKSGESSEVSCKFSDGKLQITSEDENKLLEIHFPSNALECERINISCTSGNVTLNNINVPNISVELTNGNIFINDSDTEHLEATAENGNIVFTNTSAEIAVCTVDAGSIQGTLSSREYLFDISSGEAEITTGEEAERIDINVSMGNISLTCPKEKGMNIKANTSVGVINVDMQTVFDGKIYIYKDGSIPVTLQTSAGNINVSIEK